MLIVFNGENFLAEAIDSVVNQSFEDWELVVADDGSTDGTSDILRRYQEQLGAKMIICRHPGSQNRGMSASRNLGVQHASSDVVTFLDHDDVLEPEKLHLHLEALKRHPDATTFSPRACGGSPGIPDWEAMKFRTSVPREIGCFILQACFRSTCTTRRRPNWLHRPDGSSAGDRRIHQRFRSMYEDQVMVAKLSLTTSGVVVDQPLHRYRQHALSCVRQTFSSGGHFASPSIFAWLHPYLLEHRPDDHALIKQSQDQLHVLRHEQWAWRKKLAVTTGRRSGGGWDVRPPIIPSYGVPQPVLTSSKFSMASLRLSLVFFLTSLWSGREGASKN